MSSVAAARDDSGRYGMLDATVAKRVSVVAIVGNLSMSCGGVGKVDV